MWHKVWQRHSLVLSDYYNLEDLHCCQRTDRGLFFLPCLFAKKVDHITIRKDIASKLS